MGCKRAKLCDSVIRARDNNRLAAPHFVAFGVVDTLVDTLLRSAVEP
jgi:hypothetical protein